MKNGETKQVIKKNKEKKMTNNQIVEAKGDFLTNPQLLNSGIIRKYLDPQGKASDEELAYFIAQAKAQNLNPFTKEIYFIIS